MSDAKTVCERAMDLFDELGDRPVDIAGELHQRDVRGRLEHNEDCPIARLLWHELEVQPVVVNETSIRIGDETVRPPEEVCEFIRQFDSGAYPQLVEGRVEA